MKQVAKKPPASESEAVERKIRVDRDGLVRCRVCGCTEREACYPPCSWAEADLCNWCYETVKALVEWSEGAHRANLTALLREYRRVALDTPRYHLTEAERERAHP